MSVCFLSSVAHCLEWERNATAPDADAAHDGTLLSQQRHHRSHSTGFFFLFFLCPLLDYHNFVCCFFGKIFSFGFFQYLLRLNGYSLFDFYFRLMCLLYFSIHGSLSSIQAGFFWFILLELWWIYCSNHYLKFKWVWAMVNGFSLFSLYFVLDRFIIRFGLWLGSGLVIL